MQAAASDVTPSTNNDSFISSNNESWYSDFVSPVMQKMTHDENCRMIKLGPVNISKT